MNRCVPNCSSTINVFSSPSENLSFDYLITVALIPVFFNNLYKRNKTKVTERVSECGSTSSLYSSMGEN